MKLELQNKIFKRFPKFFANKDLDMTQTCMVWGLECGGGWYQLIWDTCEKIENYIRSHPLDYEFRFDQVKSKFAGLRMYHNGNDKICEITDEAERLSVKICEECGKPGKVIGGSWIYTMCEECANKNGILFESPSEDF